jgi:hypothetical protein
MVGNPATAEARAGQPAWLSGFNQAITDLAQNDQRPISAAWAIAVQGRLRDPSFCQILDTFCQENPDVTSAEMQRRALSAEQAVIFAAQQDGRFPFSEYPSDKYTDPKMWAQLYRWLKTDTTGYSNQYYTNLVRRPLTTAVPQREVAARALRRFLPDMFGEEPLWASCGSSIMAGDKLNWLVDHDEGFEFSEVKIRSSASGRASAVSDYKTDLFNTVVREPDTIQRVVGLDQFDPTEPANLAWNRACATPEEVLSESWSDLRDRIMHADVPEDYLVFRLADLASRASMRGVVEEFGQFDGSSAHFVFYQGRTAELRRRMLLNNRKVLVKPNRAFVVSDFARIVGGAFLSPLDQWREPTVFVGHEGLLHPVFRASNGRFNEMRVLPPLAKLAVGGPHEKTVRELLS